MQTETTQRKSRTYIVWMLLLLYICFLFKVILFKFGSIEIGPILSKIHQTLIDPGSLVDRLDTANLDLFRTLRRQAAHPNLRNVVNIIGNFVIFIPFGFLISMGIKKASSGIVVLIGSFGMSLCLESLQLILSMGNFDVDDLLLNTLGGIAGYIAYYFCVAIKEVFHHAVSLAAPVKTKRACH
ncbi:VanZ family protein [Paenibacillus polygoni]|uniref:VanZ family protein n=1 Tax=Paenibacillus polygoni TaxID=3050112 RepID=A0ABY8WZV7_9BACL|nr:VanZ family protein [Paenibacillus polygoni]WIV18757.1 VanZ family protein [Paenibacillus polygoni]